jgi:hypothetical protein
MGPWLQRAPELAQPLDDANPLLADHPDGVTYEEDHRQRNGQDDDQ